MVFCWQENKSYNQINELVVDIIKNNLRFKVGGTRFEVSRFQLSIHPLKKVALFISTREEAASFQQFNDPANNLF